MEGLVPFGAQFQGLLGRTGAGLPGLRQPFRGNRQWLRTHPIKLFGQGDQGLVSLLPDPLEDLAHPCGLGAEAITAGALGDGFQPFTGGVGIQQGGQEWRLGRAGGHGTG